ncbi:MAG TPA: outer membrane beta-barrel protein [Terriglobales bacterium]|nr:outer membrane beta-barrel protein [Terriglobales bacterium]
MSHRVLCFVAVLVFSIATASAQSNFKRFNFDVGGGLGIGRGDVGKFVGGSYFGIAGGGLNLNRMFGFNAEYMYYDLPLKPSVIQQQAIPGASGHLHAVTLDIIGNAPLHGRLGAYGIGGIGWYQRSVSATRELLTSGTVCQPAWIWWDVACVNGFVSPAQTLSSAGKDAGGFNFGGGVTYRLNHLHRAKVYVEARYHRAYHSDVQTTFIPVAVGLRW